MYVMKELIRSDVAARLKSLRKEHKLTIERLAEMINVSASFIGLIEKGGSGISLENLYKLSQVYGCSLDYLIAGGEPQNNSARLAKLQSALYDFDDDEIDFVASLARFMHGKVKPISC